jgi:stage IV sporulation protein FB
MRWSYPLFRAFGIEVNAHSSFLIFLALIAVSTAFSDGVLPALYAAFMVCLLFGFVVLHELGHSLAALHFGVPVKDITLLPIGGVARLGNIPRRPWEEFVIAIAGPAVNFVLAALFLALLVPASFASVLSSFSFTSGLFLSHLAAINVGLLLFNLVPAFPMDGGRILRSLLAIRMGYLRSTRIAVRVGKLLCLGFLVYGFWSGAWPLCLIAVFVYVGASMELYAVETAMRRGSAGEPHVKAQPQGTWWLHYPSDGPPHISPSDLYDSPNPQGLPPRDLSERYEELKAQGENVTAVYSKGRIIAVVRQVD